MASASISYADQAKAIYVSATHKGGMDGIDTEKIAQIQLEVQSRGSYTAHQRKLDAAVEASIARLQARQATLDAPQRAAAAVAVQRRIEELEAARRPNRICCVVDFDMFYAAGV